MRCVTCQEPFNFAVGQTAVVLRHVAYGHDFAHEGACLDAACELIFAEPGYDCAAFARDAVRRRVLALAPPRGWVAVLPADADRTVDGAPVRFEPLRMWAVVEYQDGTRGLEGIVHDEEWLDEPGGAEFPQARRGRAAYLGYAPATDCASPARLADWAHSLNARRVAGTAASQPALAELELAA